MMNCPECDRLTAGKKIRAEAYGKAARALQLRPALPVDEYTRLRAGTDYARLKFQQAALALEEHQQQHADTN
jgi:hypothetical protein